MGKDNSTKNESREVVWQGYHPQNISPWVAGHLEEFSRNFVLDDVCERSLQHWEIPEGFGVFPVVLQILGWEVSSNITVLLSKTHS